MDFVRYAEQAAAVVNSPMAGVDDLRSLAYALDRPWLAERATDRDCMILRRLQRELRPVFGSDAVVDGLNELLTRHPITPQITDHVPGTLHIHVAAADASVADLLTGEALFGLAHLVCDLGPSRLGVCAADRCSNVWVDTSPNASRRYCSERCSSRANVAAYRARRRASASS